MFGGSEESVVRTRKNGRRAGHNTIVNGAEQEDLRFLAEVYGSKDSGLLQEIFDRYERAQQGGQGSDSPTQPLEQH